MKNNKITIDLTAIAKEKIYRKLINEHWDKIEAFSRQMELEIDKTAEKYSKDIAEELTLLIKQELKK